MLTASNLMLRGKKMNSDLTNKLKTKYPKLLENIERLDCGDGWYNLINCACHIIQHHVDSNQATNPEYQQVTAVQIKEKFGTLRFYCRGTTEYTEGVIDFAETMSGKVCEFTGNVGSLHRSPTGWMHTVSEETANDKQFTAIKQVA